MTQEGDILWVYEEEPANARFERAVLASTGGQVYLTAMINPRIIALGARDPPATRSWVTGRKGAQSSGRADSVRFFLIQPFQTRGELSLKFDVGADTEFILESSHDLKIWQPEVESSATDAEEVFSMDPAGLGQRFYRLNLPSQLPE